jgi:type VI secretion system protein ImpG
MRSQYFQDELAYLKESGNLFAEYNPKLVNYLSESSTDPDVERLLEGFAFLTSKLREKLDDELPELSQSVIQLLWPNFLKPFPSVSLLKLTPVERAITNRQIAYAGMEVLSSEIDGTQCQFQTTNDCTVYPFEISKSELIRTRANSMINLEFKSLGGLPINKVDLQDLRLWFTGDDTISQMLYLWFGRYTKKITLVSKDDGTRYNIPLNQLDPGGLKESDAIFPDISNAFSGYRLLQEYFIFPKKFLCFDLNNLKEITQNITASEFSLEFEFERPLPAEIQLRPNNIQLYCVPIINLFEYDADPILIDHKRVYYPINPANRHLNSYEIFSINLVESLQDPDSKTKHSIRRQYPNFESFDHEIESEDNYGQIYYRVKLRPSIREEGLDHLVSFVHHNSDYIIPPEEGLSVKLSCFNGTHAHELGIGDIYLTTETTPSFVKFKNITRPTSPVYPPLDGRLYWNMISNLSLNYLSLLDKKSLATILNIYDFPAHSSRQSERAAKKRSEGISNIETYPLDRLEKGMPIRGIHTDLTLKESHFQSEGEMFLFATILADFFSLYSSINSFHELHVYGEESDEVYKWPIKSGKQPLI